MVCPFGAPKRLATTFFRVAHIVSDGANDLDYRIYLERKKNCWSLLQGLQKESSLLYIM